MLLEQSHRFKEGKNSTSSKNYLILKEDLTNGAKNGIPNFYSEPNEEDNRLALRCDSLNYRSKDSDLKEESKGLHSFKNQLTGQEMIYKKDCEEPGSRQHRTLNVDTLNEIVKDSSSRANSSQSCNLSQKLQLTFPYLIPQFDKLNFKSQQSSSSKAKRKPQNSVNDVK